MKKLLLLLLCVPLLFSCGEKEEKNEKKERTTMEQKAIDECTKTLNEISVQNEEHIHIIVRDLFLKEIEELCNCAVEQELNWGDLSIIGFSKLCGSPKLYLRAKQWEQLQMSEGNEKISINER